jgi:glutamine synthetase
LGDQLTDVFEQIEKGGATSSKHAGTLTIGVDTLPPLPKHAGDRNRTSPFAFTGNKFEFRAVGSSQSIAGPLVVLNTIVAESLDYVATALEKATGGDASKLNGAVQKLVQEIIKEHKAIIFNGDNYTAEWNQEAGKRGLPNLKNTLESLPVLIAPKNVAMFEKYGVLSPREMQSRHDIYMERYCKDINTESQAALSIGQKMILPAAYRYQGELAATAASFKTLGRTVHMGTLDKVTDLVGKLENDLAALEKAVHHQGGGDLTAEAKHFQNDVIPAMKAVRDVADKLETIVADDLWPLPTYQEILFIK